MLANSPQTIEVLEYLADEDLKLSWWLPGWYIRRWPLLRMP